MKKRITIDARWLLGGIGAYIEHLLEGFAQSSNGFTIEAITRPQHAKTVAQWCDHLRIVDIPIYTLAEQVAIPRAAKEADLLHIPHYNAPLLHRGKLLVSIHDVIHLTDPAYRKNPGIQLYAKPMLRLAARKADHIITVSDYSKAQIVEHLGVPSEKVTTIHRVVNEQFCCFDRKGAADTVFGELQIKQPYVLYVGNLKPHKNVSVLLRAFALLRKRIETPLQLVVLGEDEKWAKPIFEEAGVLGIENEAHFIPQVSRELLPKLYAAASLLVMPSRVEGFGLPVLEAMASGTPVVCSNAASLPEVAGNAALYFDPSNFEELAGAIKRVLDSKDLQDDLRKKGLLRAEQLAWKKSVEKHLQVYEQLLRDE
jgi:glycosyltransferase involved in cell wall biosynthesis